MAKADWELRHTRFDEAREHDFWYAINKNTENSFSSKLTKFTDRAWLKARACRYTSPRMPVVTSPMVGAAYREGRADMTIRFSFHCIIN